ncbi:hypothetical protein HYU45_04595 [Candidatus Daviesbacteria bacterium]|nr:hypothetical protein [Candidatus Daviesbacteria bacterium]
MKKIIFLLGILAVFVPITVFAVTTSGTSPEILRSAQNDKGGLNSLYQINQKVCDRFETDILKLAAIMEELRRRKGITETRVAFGGTDTPIKNADYWVTYSAEALAFQRAQKYSSQASLRSSLEVLKNKILRAKSEVGRALNE